VDHRPGSRRLTWPQIQAQVTHDVAAHHDAIGHDEAPQVGELARMSAEGQRNDVLQDRGVGGLRGQPRLAAERDLDAPGVAGR
jgi:hypothetical protein